MTEFYGLRFAAMLSADAQLYIRPDASGQADACFHKSADAVAVDGLEWIVFQYTLLHIFFYDFTRVIPGKSVCKLGLIVGSE